MGLFSFLTKLSDGNFRLIAYNVSSIYAILKYDYPKSFVDKQMMLATAGIINAAKYIDDSKIDPQSILSIAQTSDHFDNEEDDYQQDIKMLVSFLWWFETAIFSIDTRMNYRNIAEIVEGKLNVISDTVSEVLFKADKDNKFKTTWRIPVNHFMNWNKFCSYRSMLEIVDINSKSFQDDLAAKVNDIREIIIRVAREYCNELVLELYPKSFDSVFCEVLIYFLFHLDYCLLNCKVSPELRKLVNSSIKQHGCSLLSANYTGNLSDLIDTEQSIYMGITDNCGSYSEASFEINWHFFLLLIIAKNNSSISDKRRIEKMIDDSSSDRLMTKIIDLNIKYNIPFDKAYIKSILNS